jgi:hypothetical protein
MPEPKEKIIDLPDELEGWELSEIILDDDSLIDGNCYE